MAGPFRVAARRVAAATAGVVGGSTVWRLLQQVATRVLAQEASTHATWSTMATLPELAGDRVVSSDGWKCTTGARPLAKVRELVTNGTLAPWCHRSPATPPPPPRHPAGVATSSPAPWPSVCCPPVHGPLTDPIPDPSPSSCTGSTPGDALPTD